MFDIVSYTLLSFTQCFEIFQQVRSDKQTMIECVMSMFRLDYCGIAILIVGSIVPLLYYQFYCEFGTKVAYLTLIGLLGITCIVISMWDRFSSSEYRVYRARKFF